MIEYDVAVIGGGVSGMSCVLLLCSAIKDNQVAKDKKYLIIDNGKSDLLKAELNNVPALDTGSSGIEVLNKMKANLLSYPNVDFIDSEVNKLIKKDDFYEIHNSDTSFKTKVLVLATGFKNFNIECNFVEKLQYERSSNTTRVKLKHNDYKISDTLYVCGTLSGHSSQFAIAAGSGQQVGVHILSSWNVSWTVVHDKLNKTKE